MTVSELHEELDRRESEISRSYMTLAGVRDFDAHAKLWEEEKFIDDVRDVLSELEGEREDDDLFRELLLKDARKHHAEKCSLLSGDGPCDCVVTDNDGPRPMAAA